MGVVTFIASYFFPLLPVYGCDESLELGSCGIKNWSGTLDCKIVCMNTDDRRLLHRLVLVLLASSL